MFLQAATRVGVAGSLVPSSTNATHSSFGDASTLPALQMVHVPPGSCLRRDDGALVPLEALLATSITHPHICSTFKYAVRQRGSHAGSAGAPKAVLGDSSNSASAALPGADWPAAEERHLDSVGEGGRVRSRAEVLGLPAADQPAAATVQAAAAADTAAQQPQQAAAQQALEDKQTPILEGETGAAAREQASPAEAAGASASGSTRTDQTATSAGQVSQPAAALLEAAAEAGPGKAGTRPGQSPQVAQLNTAGLPAVASDLDSAREEHGAAGGSSTCGEPSAAGPHVARAEPGTAGASSASQDPGTAKGCTGGQLGTEQPEGSAAAGPPLQPPLPAVAPSDGKQADVQPEAGHRLGKQEPAEAASATQREAALTADPADRRQLAEPRHRPWHVRLLTFWRWRAGPGSQPAAPVMTAAWNAAAASTEEGDLDSRQAGDGAAAAAAQPAHEGQVRCRSMILYTVVDVSLAACVDVWPACCMACAFHVAGAAVTAVAEKPAQ